MSCTDTKLSVVIIAKNEAATIADCLRSVQWADDIVVIDSGSTDDTRRIAGEFTDRVYEIPWRGFGPQKQAAVELARNEWVFNIDCDERMTPELADETRGILRNGGPADAYTVPRRTFIGNREIRHCGWYPDRTVRLFRRSRARFSNSLVHERVDVTGVTADCAGHLLHYSYSGIGQMLAKINTYSDLAARQMFESGRRFRRSDLVVKPAAAFCKTYLLKAGVLDGVEGLTISVTSAMVAYAKYAKLGELYRNMRQLPSLDQE